MDNELKDMLIKIIEGQTELRNEVTGIKEDVTGMKKDISGLKDEVKKNSIKLEAIETKINTIAEVQSSHMEQNDRQHIEIIKPLGEKVDVIELAVKDISENVQNLKNDFNTVEVITSKNWNDIAKLKAVK